MTAVNIREFNHHMAKYLKEVKAGERIMLMERNVPIAEIVPHNPHSMQPAWKRKITPIKIKGEPLSVSIIRARKEEEH
jgi:antitoxin (DNA-binding transcriptional repressor) of toxin-antitoxin stability system